MIKTIFALGALALVAAAPAAAQMTASTGATPMCSATVHDSCNQGANNPRAMSADQAMASGGVGDRKTDAADYMAPAQGGGMAMKKPMHKKMTHKPMHKMSTTTSTTDKPM